MSRYGWRPYVPVAERRARALKKIEKLRKEGFDVQPVEIEGRKIARTFWGAAWCDHLESFSDYANRLPRGRTYARNGSVCHLEVAEGEISAMVSGSELYEVNVAVQKLARKKWNAIKKHCSGRIGSLIELLQGRLSENVMIMVTDREKGLFPLAGEITLTCSCPDWATMCKHVAAVLYGVGARLDERPELLFLLRGVDHEELISSEAEAGAVAAVTADPQNGRRRIDDEELADVFGIEMTEEAADKERPERRKKTSESQPPPKSAAESSKKHKPKAGGKRKPTGKASSSRKSGRQKATSDAADEQPMTGRAVARLRAKFGMSKSQFAKLLGVSGASISNWERKSGTLNLQRRTLLACKSARKLTKQQAWRKLGGL